jgi:hypothetical protein
MARKQYRWFGEAAWHSASGNALLALQNLNGSGKKILVHSVEVHPQQRGGQSVQVQLALVRGTVSGGWAVPLGKMDSEATLPSGIEVRKFASVASPERILPTYFAASVQGGGSALGLTQRQPAMPHVRDWFRADKGEQGVVVRPGEAVALISDATRATTNGSWPLQVSGDFVVGGATYTFSTLTWPGTDNGALVALVNGSASDVVTLKRIGIAEVGSTVTPYFQLVPVGAVDAQSQADSLMRLTPTPVDSADGALSESVAKLIADAPVLPFGVPQVYATDLGGGAPKGMNYLHTKDLIGPAYAVLFPEVTGNADPGIAKDVNLLPMSHAARNLLSKGTPIVLREGEALGICSAAETASSSITLSSGWAIFDFGIVFSVEPTVIPSITVTGVVAGSDVVILDAGTDTVLASGDAISGTSFAWEYDADLVNTVDICIYRQGYIPLAFRGLDPGNAGITIPVAQVADRNFVS